MLNYQRVFQSWSTTKTIKHVLTNDLATKNQIHISSMEQGRNMGLRYQTNQSGLRCSTMEHVIFAYLGYVVLASTCHVVVSTCNSMWNRLCFFLYPHASIHITILRLKMVSNIETPTNWVETPDPNLAPAYFKAHDALHFPNSQTELRWGFGQGSTISAAICSAW
jgi:hypothetical protein